jgi:lycopene cyclase-like protein
MYDALVVGGGPAGLAIAAALAREGLWVAGLSPRPPEAPWPNTYGAWADEIAPLGLAGALARRWSDVTAYVGGAEVALRRDYALLDNARLQEALLAQAPRAEWHAGAAARVAYTPTHALVTTHAGAQISARLVVDASGHTPALLGRPAVPGMAYQTAYGVVGRFSQPPVRPGQCVLIDYRDTHLSERERAGPPTFLYAMDLGGGRFFVEETSLAHAPGVKLAVLERRLRSRLAHSGACIEAVEHIERCVFPMNPALPDLRQPALGFGAAASMVHPPSGYMVSLALRRAPLVAQAVAQALGAHGATPLEAARAGWQALWPAERVRRRALYLFGLACLLRSDGPQLNAFFRSFFALPAAQWAGYLSDTLSTGRLLATMLRLFMRAPTGVRLQLIRSAVHERALLWEAATRMS